MSNRWLASLTQSASLVALILLGMSATTSAYTCPAASTCAGKTCPPGTPTCYFDKDANYCNCK